MNNQKQRNFTAFVAGKAREQSTWSIIFSVFGLIVFGLNLATILTFVLNRHLRRRSAYCLINLAVADMMYGCCRTVFAFSYVIVHRSTFMISEEFYDILAVINVSSFIATGFCLILVPLERVFAIFYPFRHRTTRTRTYTMTFAVTWLLALVQPILREIYADTNPIFLYISRLYLASGFVLLVLLSTLYLVLFIKVKQRNQQQQCNRQQAGIQKAQRQERHLATTLFIVTFLSLIAWLPYLITDFARYTTGSKLLANPDVLSLILVIQFTNSFVNPMVYLFRMEDFRVALFQLLFKCSCNQRQQIHPLGFYGDRARQNQEPAVLELS